MLSETIAVAERFFDVVLKYDVAWPNEEHLPESDLAILLRAVRAAGFDVAALIPGRLFGRNRHGDRDETYPVNATCHYKAVRADGTDDAMATGWLDCAIHFVYVELKYEGHDRSETIDMLAARIELSLPLRPIRISTDGDMLLEPPPEPKFAGFEYLVDHVCDDSPIGFVPGVHASCGGWIDYHAEATEAESALVCRRCRLEVLFPKSVRTYGDLRRVLEQSAAQSLV